MILLTGATGTLGRALLPKLLERGLPVRCMVRDPRRLGQWRVQVSISIGNLADRHVFGTALRGVDTVIHLAATRRDQPRGTIEELNALATRRLVTAAARRGAQRLVIVKPFPAAMHSPVRFYRAAALAERAVREAGLDHVVFGASMIYAADDSYLGTMAAWSHVLPALPLVGGRDTEFEPIHAADAAEAIARVVAGEQAPPPVETVELAGPEVLTNEQLLHIALRGIGHKRPLVRVPRALERFGFGLAEAYLLDGAPATPDEIEMLEVPARSLRGVADIETLGVEPLPMAVALGA